MLGKSEPINHLYSVSILKVSNVEEIFKLNDFKALDLPEFGFLVVKEYLIRVHNVKKCPISVYLYFRIPRKMSPYSLIVRRKNGLVDSLLLKEWMDQEATKKHGDCKNE